MPDSCCVPNCTTRRVSGDGVSFYRIPSKDLRPKLREKWLRAIPRDKWPERLIRNAKVCSKHFLSGKRSKDPANPDHIPSVFTTSIKSTPRIVEQKFSRYKRLQERRKPKKIPIEEEQPDVGNEEVPIQNEEEEVDPVEVLTGQVDQLQRELTSRMSEIFDLRQRLSEAKKAGKYSFKTLEKNKEQFHFYVGVNVSIFKWIRSVIKGKVKKFCKLTFSNHLLIVLIKLRLGLFNKDLAYRFGIKPFVVSRIFRSWIKVIAKELLFLIIWPEKPALRANLPSCFNKFSNCICIIDCTEIFIQRPLNLNTHAQSWSNYKNTNTIKYLVGMNPAGPVSFLSEGWGGRASDKEITSKSGFLDKLQHGDMVMADRGFTIDDELALKGATLAIPDFTKGKTQMPAGSVDKSRRISNIRIHIERVIGRLRTFRILNQIIPISQVDLLDKVMVVVCALVNLNESVV